MSSPLYDYSTSAVENHRRLFQFNSLTSLTLAGFVQVVKGEGLPVYHESGHGDLFVEYSVVLPTTISASARSSKLALPCDRALLLTSSSSGLESVFRYHPDEAAKHTEL